MALTYRMRPGDTITVGDDVEITVREDSRTNKQWVQVSAPRSVNIDIQKGRKIQHIDSAC